MAERELIAFDRLPMSAIWTEEVLCCGFQVQQLIIGRLPKMEIEVNFVVIESANAKGGFDFKILTIGGINLAGIKEYEKQKAHKITLHLAAIPQPQDKEGLLDDFVKNSTFMPR